MIHALPGPEDDELCIRATAAEVTDAETRALVRSTVERSNVAGMIQTVSHDPLFEFTLTQVDTAHWLDIGQSDTHPARSHWPPT